MTKSKTAVKNADEFERLNSKRGEQMKYLGKPAGMWALFSGSFEKHLTVEFDLTAEQAKDVAARAKKKYREIIAKLPEFDKRDRFEMNIVNCAMLAAFILCMPQRPNIKTLTDYCAAAMMTPTMKAFCRASGKKKFTPKDIEGMKAMAKLRAGDRNPYSWNMDFFEYEDGSGYEARFTTCGICTLMQVLGLYDLTPALCHLDYTMSDAGGASDFLREYTLASGGPYCDCGYHKKQ